MSIIATVEAPASDLGLEHSFATVSGLSFRAEQAVARGDDAALPHLWLNSEDPKVLPDALATDESVAAADRLNTAGSSRLYRIRWADPSAFADLLDSARATLLDARGRDGRWTLRLRFAEREALSAAIDRADRAGRSLTVRRIRESGSQPHSAGLTDCQYEAIRLALADGYYEVPRRADLTALADDLGVSHQALSERLRRGHGVLAADAVDIEP